MEQALFTRQQIRFFHFGLLTLLFLRLVFQWFFSAEELARANTYGRVGYWIESSACTVKTGSFLTICEPDGTIVPIENVSLADDRGHTMVANTYAAIFQRPIDRVALTRFNLGFNFLAVVTLLGILVANGYLTAAALFGLVQLIFGFGRFDWGPDVQGIYTGLSYLSAGLLIHLSGKLKLRGKSKNDVHGISLASGAFVLATLAFIGCFREPMGLISALSSEAVLLFLIVSVIASSQPLTGKTKMVLSILALMLTIPFMPKLITRSVTSARDRLFAISPSMAVSSHGIAHSLYIGLGTRPNPWGIRWDDTSALEAVQRIKKDTAVASPEYFDILWKEYFRIVRENPGTALDIYFRKLLKSLEVVFHSEWAIVILWLLLFFVPMGRQVPAAATTTAVAMSMDTHMEKEAEATKIALAGLTILFLGGLFQGVLGSPGESFLIPAAASAEVLFIVASGATLRATRAARMNHLRIRAGSIC